jgi:hypothetical protein
MPDQSTILSPISGEALAQALGDVLEATAFVSLMPLDPDAPAPVNVEMYWIEFAAGACRGAVELVVPRAFGQMLADNLLGPDADEDDAAALDPSDGLKELLNVACGKILQALPAEIVSQIEMGLPQRRAYDGGEPWQAYCAAEGAVPFDADGHAIAARVRVES